MLEILNLLKEKKKNSYVLTCPRWLMDTVTCFKHIVKLLLFFTLILIEAVTLFSY